ncbi:unnamed protein product, partial [Nesidiocoris tenuis]
MFDSAASKSEDPAKRGLSTDLPPFSNYKDSTVLFATGRRSISIVKGASPKAVAEDPYPIQKNLITLQIRDPQPSPRRPTEVNISLKISQNCFEPAKVGEIKREKNPRSVPKRRIIH